MIELLVFNVFPLLGVVAAMLHVRAKRDRKALLVGGALIAGGAVVGLAVGMAVFRVHYQFVGFFGRLTLLAFVVFLHAPVYLLVSAFLLRERRWLARACAAAAAVLVAVGIEAFLVEPHWLDVSRHRIATTKLDAALRIVVLADIQTDEVGAYERRALETAMSYEPDLILLPGDYLHVLSPDDWTGEAEALSALFRDVGLGAPLGVVAVEGNVDPAGWPVLFEHVERAHCFTRRGRVELGPVVVTGLSLYDSFEPTVVVDSAERFHIAVGHAPDFALSSRVEADLLIAGHTHGGQVRLPFLGPLVTLSRVPRAWAAGRTELAGGRTLVVSRGVGLERGYAPRLRFGCRPELVVIDLEPATSAGSPLDGR